jgi:biotin transport system substrate-specific component
MSQTKTFVINRDLFGTAVINQTLWIVVFSLLTALGAHITVPHDPVPFTLQTFFTLLSGALLGKRNGTLSQFLYLAFGAIGLPVFAVMPNVPIGIARLFGPTGGYLLAMPLAAFIVGWLVQEQKSFLETLLAMTIGLLIIFTLGIIQLNLVLLHDWGKAFASGFLIFSWWDALKLVAAATIYSQFEKHSS